MVTDGNNREAQTITQLTRAVAAIVGASAVVGSMIILVAVASNEEGH